MPPVLVVEETVMFPNQDLTGNHCNVTLNFRSTLRERVMKRERELVNNRKKALERGREVGPEKEKGMKKLSKKEI